MVTGIICEYNPFHNGHKKQFDRIRAADPEASIVCLMSGNFVQRGAPAILDKNIRAKAALLCGADLVLELPVTYALRSAEGFAAGGVSILSSFCQRLCFGAEDAAPKDLTDAARALLSEEYTQLLRLHLERGLSFPAARQAALEQLGINGALISKPNNILAVEYCKAILAQKSSLIPMPIYRQGDYHSTEGDHQNPSATFVRGQMHSGSAWRSYVPKEAADTYEGAVMHSLADGEKSVLYRLRTMTDEEFEALPYGSEGLWRKLMRAARSQATLEDILTETKSKRYTRSRLDRMVMCAFLGITRDMLDASAPYVRVLALNEKGRSLLRSARIAGAFPNTGTSTNHPYQLLENRCGDLYGLFSHTPQIPGTEKRSRLYYKD